MKKYFVSAALLVLVASCGGGSGSEANKDTASSAASTQPAAATDDITANPDYKAGLALIAKSNCLTCHKVTEKLIGPAYDSVAMKYAGVDTAVTYLAKKVIAGGSGVWGTVPMTPHPEISQADAEQMVKYILLLKNQ